MEDVRVYDDHVPSHEWLREEGADTLIVHVPGFKKEHLKVIICRDGKVVATGERPLPTKQKRSKRFREEFRLPEKCNVEGIKSELHEGIMRVVFPKLTMEEKSTGWKKKLKTVSMGIGLHELAMVGLVMAATVAAWCSCHKLDCAENGRHGVFPAT